MKKETYRAMSAALVLGLALTGCTAGPDSGAPDSTSELRIAFSLPTDTVDPHVTSSNQTGGLLSNVFQSLTKVTAAGEVVGVLATDWKAAEDGLSWEFKLREDVVFSDGTPFNAEAVRVNIERVIDEDFTVPLRTNGTVGLISGVNVIDEFSVQISTESPFSGLPIGISHITGAMISPLSIDEWGSELGQHSGSGTGPYKLESFQLPGSVSLVANETYWGDSASVEKISIVSATDNQTRTNSLLSGQVDLDLYADPESIKRIKDDPAYTVFSTPSIRLFMIHLPMNLPEMQDVRVRQALNYAIDREQIVNTLYDGAASSAKSSISPGVIGAVELDEYEYDVAKAEKLLGSAGWTKNSSGVMAKNGDAFPTIHLEASRGRYPQDANVAQAVMGYLAKIGIPVKLQLDEPATFFELAQNDARENNWMTQFAWGFPQLDGSDFLCAVYIDDNIYNFGGYVNDEVKEICGEIRSTFDVDERSALIQEGAAIVYEDVPAIYLLTPDYLAAGKGIADLELNSGERHDYLGVSFE